jgi:hypothetical protein
VRARAAKREATRLMRAVRLWLNAALHRALRAWRGLRQRNTKLQRVARQVSSIINNFLLITLTCNAGT